MQKLDKLKRNQLKNYGIAGDYAFSQPNDLDLVSLPSYDIDEVIEDGEFVQFRASIRARASVPLRMQGAWFCREGQSYPIVWHDEESLSPSIWNNRFIGDEILNQYFDDTFELIGNRRGTIYGYFRAPCLLGKLQWINLTLELQDQYDTIYGLLILFSVRKRIVAVETRFIKGETGRENPFLELRLNLSNPEVQQDLLSNEGSGGTGEIRSEVQ